MLNELAEIFLIKNMHLEIVVESFNKAMQSLSVEEQKKALQKIDVTKVLTESVEKIDSYKTELENVKLSLDETQETNIAQKKKYEKKISELKKKISGLEKDSQDSTSSQFYIKDGTIQLGNPNYLESSTLINFGTTSMYGTANPYGFLTRKCDSCSAPDNSSIPGSIRLSYFNAFRTCPSCNRYLCDNCWPNSGIRLATTWPMDRCPRCQNEANAATVTQ